MPLLKRCLLPILICASAVAQTAPAGRKLVYAVVLSRHGIRAPLGTNESLSQYSSEAWPSWGVAPGELTEHGAKALAILGGWYREWFAQDGLLPASGCESATMVHMRADLDQRTRASARAFLDGMFPGCNVPANTVSAKTDPLFHAAAAGLTKGNAELSATAVSGRIGNRPEALAPTLSHAFLTLREVLFGCKPDSPCPAETQPGKQGLLTLPASVTGTEDGLADIRGPLRTGSTLAENLLLEYADGKTNDSKKDLGWGRLDENKLEEIGAIHTAYADLARRTEYLARLQGSNMLSHILNSMEQAVSGKPVPGALGKPGDRLLLLAGHDTNISHISGMLNLSWLLPGYQRDDTPPGGSLVFRLWKNTDATWTVDALYIAQTLDQMRSMAAIGTASPPAIANLFVQGCSSCDWEHFRQAVTKSVDPKCVTAQP
jgi:4-phytase/acid phosphatase